MLKLNVSSGGRVMGQLELPAPLDEFKQKVDALCAAGQPNITPAVFNADSPVPALNWHLQQIRLDSDATLRKLNQLAEAVDGMSAAGRCQLSKSLDPEFQQSLDDVLQIAVHIKPGSLDCYEVIPGVTSDQELGKWLVEHDHLEDKAPETLRPYLDYRSIGIDYRNEHEGVFLADGYTGIRTGAMEQVSEEQGVMRLTLAMSKNTFSLSLPAGEDRLEQAKRALEIEDFSQAVIAGIDYTVSCLGQLIPMDCISVEDANEMAFCLRQLKAHGEVNKYCAALEVEEPSTFTEALDMAIDIDDYELISGSEREYGRQALRRIGADDELLDTIDGYMDFDQFGRAMMEEDGVRQTGFGQVRRLSKPFPPEPEFEQMMV